MADDSPISDDPGTILESYVGAVKKASSPVPAAVPAARGAGPAEEVLYKSPYRWKAPRILICDDDSLDEGETVHVRSDKIVIGRTKGDIVIGHDVAMSSSHAEIARRDYGGKHAWILSDLGSSNGTYVRARSVTLRPGIIILIGSKRFRFDLPYPSQPAGDPQADPGTMLVTDIGSLATDALPALVEVRTPAGAAAARHPFAKTCAHPTATLVAPDSLDRWTFSIGIGGTTWGAALIARSWPSGSGGWRGMSGPN